MTFAPLSDSLLMVREYKVPLQDKIYFLTLPDTALSLKSVLPF